VTWPRPCCLPPTLPLASLPGSSIQFGHRVQRCVPNCTGSGLEPRDRDRLPVGCHLTWRYGDWNVINEFQLPFSLAQTISVVKDYCRWHLLVGLMRLTVCDVCFCLFVGLFTVYLQWTLNKRWRHREGSKHTLPGRFPLISPGCDYSKDVCPSNSADWHSLQFSVNKIIYKIFGAMAKDSYGQISEYFGIPSVEQSSR